MLRTHRAGKGPGGCGGWGLGSRNRRGPGVSPHPSSQRAGDLTWEPSRLPGLEWAGHSCSSSPLLLLQSWRAPPTCLSCPPVGVLPMPPGPMWPGVRGALEGRGPAWELSRLPGPQWAGQTPSAPLPLLLEGPSCLPLLNSPWPPSYAPKTNAAREVGVPWRTGDQPGSSAGSPGLSGMGSHPQLLSCSSGGFLLLTSPDLPGLRGADPVWPPLLLPTLSPTSYQFTWGLLPSPWVSGSLTSGWQVPQWGEDANLASSHTAILTLPPKNIFCILVLCQIYVPQIFCPSLWLTSLFSY